MFHFQHKKYHLTVNTLKILKNRRVVNFDQKFFFFAKYVTCEKGEFISENLFEPAQIFLCLLENKIIISIFQFFQLFISAV